MCANTCTHSQAGEGGRVLPCQLIVTPSAVTQTHSSGDSQRTSSALTDTFQHWHAVRKPTWSLSLPPYVLEANCPRWSWTWKQIQFYLFQMWLKSCPHSVFPPMNVSSQCFFWTQIVFSGNLLAVQNDRFTLNPEFSFWSLIGGIYATPTILDQYFFMAGVGRCIQKRRFLILVKD